MSNNMIHALIITLFLLANICSTKGFFNANEKAFDSQYSLKKNKKIASLATLASKVILVDLLKIDSLKNFDLAIEDVEKRLPAACLNIIRKRVNEPIDFTKSTLLHEAIKNKDLLKVQMLIMLKADVNAADRFGMTPFLLASMGFGDCIDLLVLNNANLEDRNCQGYNCLMLATKYNSEALVPLLSAGVDVNSVQDNTGYTSLMLAARYNHSVVQLLINKGALVNLKARNGATAYSIAKNSGNITAARQILQAIQEIKE